MQATAWCWSPAPPAQESPLPRLASLTGQPYPGGPYHYPWRSPIEFLHRDQRSIVSQREIAIDTADYLSALRACLRQAPDVILLGEMRDHETIRTAMTAAETGHLLIATLHTKGAVNTIDRIVDAFPPAQQAQIRVQLSMVLRTVVSQQLLPGPERRTGACL